MVTSALLLLFGFAILVWGANRFVEGSASTSRHLGVPPLLIGMVIIGFGTSAPEVAISCLAAAEGKPSLALGNAFGANTANLGVILGVAVLVMPITLNSRALRGETAILALVTALCALLVLDGTLSRLDALILLGVLAAATIRNVRQALRLRHDELARETAESLRETRLSLGRSLGWIGVGFLSVLGGSQLVVWGSTAMAHAFGFSELFIGLTIVSVGTSLPELAISSSAAWRHEDDLALGNVIGSNLFNTTAVVGLAGVIRPLPVSQELLMRDLPVMGGFTMALAAMILLSRGEGRIGRMTGALLLLSYAGYVLLLVRTSTPV